MQFYFALLTKDADSAYGVTFPDLPGCFSAADDFGQVLPNAREALALWFADQPPVRPMSAAEALAHCADAIAGGALLIVVPHVAIDDDNPEWTAEDFARARPAAEMLPPEVLAAFGKRKR